MAPISEAAAAASSSSTSAPSRKLSLSPPSLLPLPRALRQNRSFANLAKLIGIATDTKDESDSGSDQDGSMSPPGDDDDDDDEEEQNSEEVDDESLMWDAQTALIAHQPALAAKYYATAALPPHRSFAACLALGNLLARGSALEETPTAEESAPPTPQSPSAARSPQSAWFASFFRNKSPTTPPPPVERPPPRRLTSQGWGLPTDGKRAVRNVEGMGKAGGWLILGIGWLIEMEKRNAPARLSNSRRTATGGVKAGEDSNEEDDGALRFAKGKTRARQSADFDKPVPHMINDSTSSSERSDSSLIRTPDEGNVIMPQDKTIKVLYDLLTPLVHLYRHGHIQKHDPVYLPPLASSQLPAALKPQGDKEKGRNAWLLGSAVASKLLDLDLLYSPNMSKEAKTRQHGVLIMTQYILGLTSNAATAEACFKSIVKMGPCGLELPDDLIRQAYRRLNVILKSTGGSPLPVAELEAYPFPLTPGGKTHSRRMSGVSVLSTADSVLQSSLRLMTPAKSTVSLTSLSCDNPTIDKLPRRETPPALRSLRDIQSTQRRITDRRASTSPENNAWWPSLTNWTMTSSSSRADLTATSPEQDTHLSPPRAVSTRKPTPTNLRAVASSPELNLKSPPSNRRRLPFEPSQAVASIDPELAALELASALTKHVKCSVCGADGVNFPNCRKCGLTFCSRPCRVDEAGAGNGKRHVCGAWESRRLLTIPESPNLRPSMPKVH